MLLCGLWLLGGTASFLRHHGQEDEITSERRRVISRSLFIITIGKSSVDDLSLDELVLYAGLAKECLCGGTVLANAKVSWGKEARAPSGGDLEKAMKTTKALRMRARGEKTIMLLSGFLWRFSRVAVALGVAALVQGALASENVPRRPFAYWAELPEKGEFVVGAVYQESEAYHIWAAGRYHNVSWPSGGESYGNDVTQGYIALQYGITERWAFDLNVGYASSGWRFYDNGSMKSTSGLMDTSFGVRYQIYNETNVASPWVPTLTFRAGAVLPGTYNQDFTFAPGLRSAAIEPAFLLRKHFGWPGLGFYGDGLFRWNRTTHNDQYIIASGFFQEIKGWEIDLGYKHLQTLSGSDIIYPVDPASNGGYNIIYPRDPRENYDAVECGFSYTTATHHWRYGFHLSSVLDGNNTDAKFGVGGSIDIPFGGHHKQ